MNEPLTVRLNERQLAKRFACTTRCLQKWRGKGVGPRYFRLGGRMIRYNLVDIEKWENEQYATSNNGEASSAQHQTSDTGE